MHSARYRDYIESDAWRQQAAEARERAGHRCERCGLATRLEVHHWTYERLGDEAPGDLSALCPECHSDCDTLRATWTDGWDLETEEAFRHSVGDDPLLLFPADLGR